MLSSGITPNDPHYAELLGIAARQTRRLQDMIENFISVARMEAGGIELTAEVRRRLHASSTLRWQNCPASRTTGDWNSPWRLQPDIRVMADAAENHARVE